MQKNLLTKFNIHLWLKKKKKKKKPPEVGREGT